MNSSAVPHVAFLALGPTFPQYVSAAMGVVHNIEAFAGARIHGAARYTNSMVQYHVVIEEGVTERAQQAISARAPATTQGRVHLHSASSDELHTRLSSTTSGNGATFLRKCLMHRVLPVWVPRVIVLDTDVFVLHDIGELWRLFDRFPLGALIGVAEEQCPSYKDVCFTGSTL